jgi:hypothetical protein
MKSVAVSRHTDSSVEEVCCHSVGPGTVSPITVAVISEDGRGTSARIEIEAGRMMQGGAKFRAVGRPLWRAFRTQVGHYGTSEKCRHKQTSRAVARGALRLQERR